MRNPRNYSMLVDAYEFMMSDAYLNKNKQSTIAVFDVFFRKVPNGGYAVMAGLDKIIDYVKELSFSEEDIAYLAQWGYSEAFLEYLRNFRFSGDIYAIPDGTPVFPNEPLITVKAPLLDAQIVETAILSMINGSMEHATGARRIIEAVPENVAVMEFGARRADGCEAAIDSSIYGIMAGCSGTSNVFAAKLLGTKALGTMAHSFVETFSNEYDAFLAFAEMYPDNALFLVDTYDTLRSGVPNAIRVFETMRERGCSLDHIGIRIDSGDLAYLSKKARKMLDTAGFPMAKICLSNGLTAETIQSLIQQGAKFDTLGVGDNISKPEGRMGCVYKEVALIENGVMTPKIKISNDVIKIVNPGWKKLYRIFDNETGYALADLMCERDEELPADDLTICSLTASYKQSMLTDYHIEELQKPIFVNGELVYQVPTLAQRKAYCKQEMERIFPEVRRVYNPHEYYVDGTVRYTKLKHDMVMKMREEATR